MKNKAFGRFYLFSLIGVLIASFYPIYMGAAVIADMIRYGTVYADNYPKYIIPYTPISIAVIIGVALLPLITKEVKKRTVAAASILSVGVFFAAELMFESMVTVTKTVTGYTSALKNWQMFMCSSTLISTGTRTEVDILMGEYSPAFKIHFYIISVVIIISAMNCFYGFATMIKTGDQSRKKPLILQSAASAAFLGMCIWACFTAFYRTGSIRISALSALLMSLFFILFGVTMGIYVSSFTLAKRKLLSVALPAATAALTTLVMYIGEMILLDGHLYRFGDGILFDGIPLIVLSPVDILIILASGAVTALAADAVSGQGNSEN